MPAYPKPFDPGLFPAVQKYVPPEPKAKSSSEDGTKVSLSGQGVLRPPASNKPIPLVDALWLQSAQSARVASDTWNDRDLFAKQVSGENFCFAPGVDQMAVAWKVKDPEGARSLKLELYSITDKATAIWTKEITDMKQAVTFLMTKGTEIQGEHTGCLSWTEVQIPKNTKLGKSSDAFPDGCITVEHAPYQLRLTITPKSEGPDSVGWTYTDVLVHSLDLTWGAFDLLPTEPRSDIDEAHRDQITAAEKQILEELAADGKGPDEKEAMKVYLVSNFFCTNFSQYTLNTPFVNFKKMWGNGPRIPLIAQIFLQRADGAGVCTKAAAPALGNVRFLWDWFDVKEREDAFLQGAYDADGVKAFLQDSLDYKTSDPLGPPGSDNCHKDHGGKRGGDPIFPDQNASAEPQAVTGPFPFKVEACATRKWAAFSYARTSGDHACTTGVIFQPSRMAKDTYKAAVFLARDADALDVADAAEKLLEDNPGLPYANSGVFEIWRRIYARYLRKSNFPRLETARASTLYSKAGIDFVWLEDVLIPAQEIRNSIIAWKSQAAASNSVKVGQIGLADLDQATGGYLCTFKSWEVQTDPLLAQACDAYASKDRYINDKKKSLASFITQYKREHASATDKEAKEKWYDTLTVDQKKKVDKIYNGLRGELGIGSKESDYNGTLGISSKSMALKVVEDYISAHLADSEGIAFFHFEYKHAYLKKNGTLEPETADVGGIAPGKLGASTRAAFLLYMPAQDKPGVMDPRDVAAHEIAHNLFLAHAPDSPNFSGGPPGYDAAFHADHDDCLMNYIRATKHLCGVCLLRLRGWSVLAEDGCVGVKNKGSDNKKT